MGIAFFLDDQYLLVLISSKFIGILANNGLYGFELKNVWIEEELKLVEHGQEILIFDPHPLLWSWHQLLETL